MKVVYFHQYFSTPTGSGGIRSYAMARRLVARGHEVLMVCGSEARSRTGLAEPFTSGRRQGVVDGIRLIEFDLAYSNRDSFIKRTFTFLAYALRTIPIALTERYDVMIATSTPLTAAIPGIFARWCRGRRFVFEVRDLWPELPRAMKVITNPLVLGGMSVLEWLGYHSAVHVIGLSPGIVKGISRRGIAPARITMIPNGSDLDIFSATVETWRPAGVADTDLMAVFAGTHGIANGLDAVLDAAAALLRHGRRDIKLVLVGDGKLKPALMQRAATEGLTNVVFHDPVNKTRLVGLMQATDVGMQILDDVPAFYDGTSPNKFFDYLASGLPVLINYPGWLAEVVREHRCGFAVPPRNPEAFAAALIEAADGRGQLPQMGARARQLAQTEFDRNRLADTFVDVLERAAAG